MSIYRPAPPHNSLLAPSACLCVECAAIVLTLRCTATDADGHQCGNYKHHRGSHTMLVCTTFAIAAARVADAARGEAPAT